MAKDYSKYSTEELLDVKENIDPKIAPENYENLIEELSKRQEEIDSAREREIEGDREKTFQRVKLIGYLQLFGGMAFFGYCVWTGVGALEFALVCALATLSVAAGWLLLKEHSMGYDLTYVNQILQLISVNVGSISYNYAALGGVYIQITGEGGFFVSGEFSPGIILTMGDNSSTGHITVDILALVVLLLVGKKISYIKK